MESTQSWKVRTYILVLALVLVRVRVLVRLPWVGQIRSVVRWRVVRWRVVRPG